MRRKHKKEKLPHVSGIYAWEVVGGNPNKIGWKYIGQTIDFSRRKTSHVTALKGKYQESSLLQRYYNKYGKDSIKFIILYKCEEQYLDFWEKWFIKSFDSYKGIGFNLTEGGKQAIGGLVSKVSILKNYRTGEIVECKSRAEFGRKHNLSAGQISDVINGISQYAGDWYCPETKKWEPEIYKVVGPDDKEYEILNLDVADFCKKHNLNSCNFWEMLKGDRQYHCGWCLLDKKHCLKRRTNIREFKLISPNGILFEGKNIETFARENGLDARAINSLVNGKSYHCKGWRKHEEGMELTPFNPEQNKKEFIERIIQKNPITKLVNPEGVLFETQNISGLCKENELQNSAICLVLKGKLNHHKGWRKYNSDADLKPFHFEIYKFVSPDGKIYETTNQHELARQFNVLNQGFCDLWHGRLKTYKGWTKYKETK